VSRAFLLLALLLPVFAQQEPPSPTIRTDVPLVLVPVSVTDKKGNLIDGLKQEDFRLTDDGYPQQIRLDTPDTLVAPVSMVILVQANRIAVPAVTRLQQVAPLVKPVIVGQQGQAAVIAFDDEARVLQDFTFDADAIRSAIGRIPARTVKKSAMLDAVGEAVKLLRKRPASDRKVIFLVSESRDRGSKLTLREARELAERSGAVVYSATYSVQKQYFTTSPETAPSLPDAANYFDVFTEFGRMTTANAAGTLARATGGRHLSFTTVEALENLIKRMGDEIHSQYLLSFAPRESRNMGFHELEVTIPSRKEAVIRVRQGYWPERSPLPDPH
jgi:VWFA-related protein